MGQSDEREKGFTHLDTPALIMDIMKRRILLVEPLQRIPRQAVSAMVIYALHDGNGAEAHGLADCETGEPERYGRANGVNDESFGESVVESTKGVRDVDLVVMCVQIT